MTERVPRSDLLIGEGGLVIAQHKAHHQVRAQSLRSWSNYGFLKFKYHPIGLWLGCWFLEFIFVACRGSLGRNCGKEEENRI